MSTRVLLRDSFVRIASPSNSEFWIRNRPGQGNQAMSFGSGTKTNEVRYESEIVNCLQKGNDKVRFQDVVRRSLMQTSDAAINGINDTFISIRVS